MYWLNTKTPKTIYFRDLNKKALSVAEAVFENTMLNRGSSRRKTHSEMQDKLNTTVNDVRLYEKAVKQFPNKETQAQLSKHLLKSTATEVTNTIFSFIAEESGSHPDITKDKELTPEVSQLWLTTFVFSVF